MGKLLLIDNQDSFTHNLAQLVVEAGGEAPQVVPGFSLPRGARLQRRLAPFAGLLLSPGPGLPEEFPYLEPLLDLWPAEKPLLGICLGHQALCRRHGAVLESLEEPRHGQPGRMVLTEEGLAHPLFRGIPGESWVGLYHSWALFPENRGPRMDVLGVSRQAGYVMAAAVPGTRHAGVQFHPESFITPEGRLLMENFLCWTE